MIAPAADALGTAPLLAPTPDGRLYGSPRHSLLLTASGTGYATCGGRALTRWRGDRLGDPDGFFVYVRDPDGGAYWSAGYAPTRREPDRYAVRWGDDGAAIEREDDGLATRMEVRVAGAVEVRRVTVENLSARARRAEVTSYAEPVLQPRAADLAHPAFSKLFVETERLPGRPVLLARRRPRGADEAPFFLVHALADGGPAEHETDRARFVGRGRSVHAPAALATSAPLSGTTGAVLDPVVSLRRTLSLGPGERATVTFLLAGADTRDGALALLDAFDPDAAGPLADEADAPAEALVAGMLYGAPALRAPAQVLRAAPGGPSRRDLGLGGGPLAAVRVETQGGVAAAEALARACARWRARGLDVALLVVCDGKVSPDRLRSVVGDAGVVLDRADVPDAVLAEARLYADDALPTPDALDPDETAPVRLAEPPVATAASPARPAEPLRHDNGTGGFSADGTEYVVRVTPTADGWALPPQPWANVVASPDVGFVVTERGAGSTWTANSREHRLTPWSNDPVEDPHGEALYLRSEAGAAWSVAPGPRPARAPYTVRHGWGYSAFEHAVDGLAVEATEFVALGDAVRVSRLRVTNTGAAPRRVEAVRYAHLVLGALTAGSDRWVETEWDEGIRALLARNPRSGALAGRVAVLAAVGGETLSYTASRDAFVGRHRDAGCPRALAEPALDGRTGVGLDPCAALAVGLDVGPGETAEVSFLLGEGDGRDAALGAVARLRAPGAVDQALDQVRAFWAETAGAVQVETPEPALDVLVNGWLVYQTLSCRMWGRTAFYQSGGAFGYRDQLQDASALVYGRPDLTRAQVVLHAGRQFAEGDVLHWWHPPAGGGIRTRFSDDLHWLPYVAAFYLRTTGDQSVLDERAPFLTGPPLDEGEDERFVYAAESGESGTVYDHAVRALDRGLATGPHGLPLMGTGDWNDGMNRVGRLGTGESVWMATFLHEVLGDWAEISAARGDAGRAGRYRQHRAHLAERLNADGAGWDGAWFRRAYYDDGTPLGTAGADECQIDALVQAWSVLSGAATPDHARQALDALDARLVDEDARIVRLLAPPFDRTGHDPGYIKGYVPGVRENGGQYTHAALWAARAFAQAGRADRAARVLAMLSPVSHAATAEGVARYQAEPYSVAADVYGVAPHTGRGGWTWYTGSAGWMYRVAVESVLGFGVEGGEWLTLAPVLPTDWPGFRLRFRVPDSGGTVYAVAVERGPASATVDGEPVALDPGGGLRVPLVRDGRAHAVRLAVPVGAE